MKRDLLKKLSGVFLALALTIGMMPATELTAFATTKTEITNLSFTFRSQSNIPAVGDPITHYASGAIDEVDDELITLTGSGLTWHDENGAVINDTSDDHGYCFEAGRTYYAEIVAKADDPETYQISENAAIALTNPGDFNYVGEVVDITDTIGGGHYATIRLTITMKGQRTYPDITKVVFADTAAPAAGDGPVDVDLYYNNCGITSEDWYDSNSLWVSNFVADETYTRKIVLTAKDGYAFDENVEAELAHVGVAQEPASKVLTQNNTVLTLTYTYTIAGITWIDCVEAQLAYSYTDVTPYAGDSAAGLNSFISVASHYPYEKISQIGNFWYDEYGEPLSADAIFEAGKTYYFEIAYTVKDEHESEYRFSRESLTTSITGEGYTGRGFLKAERVEDNTFDDTYVKFRYYFTAQFPEGVGDSANNPAMCNSYAEFKCAMENEYIRYVALGNVSDTMTKKEGDSLIFGILVSGTKHLSLLGDAAFFAPSGNNIKTYDSLLKVGADSALYIQGSGGLTFKAIASSGRNAVVCNQGGNVIVESGTLVGSYNTATYGMAIWQEYGNLTIKGGVLCSENADSVSVGDASKYPVYLAGGNTEIYDGNFSAQNVGGGIGDPYGLSIANNANVSIYGGSFHGIKLDSGARVGDYIADGYVMTRNGIRANADNYATIPSTVLVEVYKEISEIELSINTPSAGNAPDTSVYGAPDGSTVESVVWYENGQALNSPSFVVGNIYKVEISLTADDGVKFADPLTSATINHETAKVVAQNIGAEYGVILTLEFGECPDTVPLVELTVTAPKEGNAPSYTIGCASDAYYAVGGSSNYTEYRQWYMSSDGDDWWEVGASHQFMSGYYYKLYVDICTNNGYEFPSIDAGTIQPNVSATVNGYYANVYKAYEQDPSRYITVEYNFGECNDSMVENIIVDNVTAPTAGEKPSYTYSILGSGYQMNTAKNAYYDDWMNNQKLYYIKNGIGWFDLTDSDWVYENETFIPGHEYQVNVYLITEDGYEFAHNKWYEPTVAAAVNGNTAEAIIDGSDCAWSQRVIYVFPKCAAAPEASASVSGTVTSQGDASEPVTLQLYSEGAPEPAYETIVTGNNAHYYFAGVSDGSYLLKVSKAGHRTREYNVTVNGSSIIQNCELELINNAPTFTDVSKNDYYYDAVLWAVEQGITAGTSATTFSPSMTCTRAQAVTFLWNAAGKPAAQSCEMLFTDVPTSAWYRNAVLWAVEQGITAGTSATTFSPDNDCTRAQIVTFLWNAEGKPAPSGSGLPFTDVPANAWYRNAVLWAVENGVTAGISATKFGPNNECTRAQIVTLMYNHMAD